MNTKTESTLERKEILFRVYRNNPQIDANPYYDNFRIEVEKGITVLRAMNYIKEHMEPRLTYRHYCQAGICGSCAMKINGVSKLACTTQVWDELDRSPDGNTIIVEPISNLPILRDMVVDMNPVVSKMVKYKTWNETGMSREQMGKKEYIIPEDHFLKYDKATDCILCASCLSECTIMEANNKFVSPLIMLRAYRMNVDERDVRQKDRLEVMVEDHGVWDCTHCFRCVEACVKKIPIMDAIHGLREEAIEKRGLNDTEGSRHGKAFLLDIKDKGHLVEALLPIRTWGLIKAGVKMLPVAIKALPKGKVPPPPFLMKPISGIKQLRENFKELDKKHKNDKKH